MGISLKRLIEAWIRRPSFCYDAAAILGFGKASSDPLPDPAPGEGVIRVGAWSLKDLRTNDIVVRDKLMSDDTWYDKYDCSGTKLTPGVYRVRLRIQGSTRREFTEQQKLLFWGEEVAPAALVATALLCHLKLAGKDLLDDDWTRCAEPLPDEGRVALAVGGGRVRVYNCWGDARRDDDLWLAGCRK